MPPVTLTLPRPQPQLSNKVQPLRCIILAAALTYVRMKQQATLKAAKKVVEAINQDQPITQEQSLEMAQILLLVSFAQICYLRNLLPDTAFEDRDWSDIPEGTHWGYTDFLAGIKPTSGTLPQGNKAKQAGKPVKILTQNGSTGAQKIMSWLNGIFDALRKGVLARLQFSIVTGPDRLNDVIEAYNFRFEDTDNDGDVTTDSDGVRNAGQTADPIAITDARHGVAALIRYLVELVEKLPSLPKDWALTVHAEYTHDCPVGYICPGFNSSPSSRTINVPQTDHWRMTARDFGDAHLGYHRVGLRVNYLVVDDPGVELDGLEIPSDLPYNKIMGRFEDIATTQLGKLGTAKEALDEVVTQRNDAVQRKLYKAQETISTRKQTEHSIEGSTTAGSGDELCEVGGVVALPGRTHNGPMPVEPETPPRTKQAARANKRKAEEARPQRGKSARLKK